MTEYKELLEFSRPDFVSSIHVKRLEEQGLLEVFLQISFKNQEKSLSLKGFNDLAESISSLLTAERAIVSREIGTGKEFGTIRIECWNDSCYSEFWCDSASTIQT